ncbi:hypothetical protein P4O66_012072 [Electrophorus voltai]|uniref:Uncharacterized protein n=1 Tax=Electrophorus voltai TaxID=2609070 RepID=A0AAD8Z3I8_9TELE|nr:hypothetical protein P4O66_012072 [Electrophorus voltai]
MNPFGLWPCSAPPACAGIGAPVWTSAWIMSLEIELVEKPPPPPLFLPFSLLRVNRGSVSPTPGDVAAGQEDSSTVGQFKTLLGAVGRPESEQNVPDLNCTAQRGGSKDRLSESSTHSLSGRGYSGCSATCQPAGCGYISIPFLFLCDHAPFPQHLLEEKATCPSTTQTDGAPPSLCGPTLSVFVEGREMKVVEIGVDWSFLQEHSTH